MVTLKFIIFVIFNSVFIAAQTSDQIHYGVLSLENATSSLDESSTFCITYEPLFHDIAENKANATSMILLDLTKVEGGYFCRTPMTPFPSLNGKAVAVKRGNCTFSEKAELVQSLNGSALLIVSPYEMQDPIANSSSDYEHTKIIVAMISDSDFQAIQGFGELPTVKFYKMTLPGFDFNVIFIWLTAVFTVFFGSFWSGTVSYQLWLHKKGQMPLNNRLWLISESEEKNEFQFTPKLILFTVIIMCAMLLGLYLLYDYLIYVIIVLFALASSYALYDALWSLLLLLPPFASCRIPPNKIIWLRKQPEVRELVLLFCCFGVGLWWFFVRHESYSWILQDILGVVFCMHMMKKMRLQSLKICAMLLILLFIYDIFFVFITPLFTKDGSSVMVDIATGRGSKSDEKIPIVLLFPRMAFSDAFICFKKPFSLLGFGDILLPGLLISFCCACDLKYGSKYVYLFGSVVAYGVGLVLTFIGLFLMQKGQPALLYLVPCLLITVILMAFSRKELSRMWTGKMDHHENTAEANGSTQRSESMTIPLPQMVPDYDANADNYSSAGEEDRMLGEEAK